MHDSASYLVTNFQPPPQPSNARLHTFEPKFDIVDFNTQQSLGKALGRDTSVVRKVPPINKREYRTHVGNDDPMCMGSPA